MSQWGGEKRPGSSFALAADVDSSSMPSNTPDPASELARLDEARSLLAQLLQLATQREAALAAQTEGLRVPPSASDAGEGSSLLLSSVMEDQPNFLASSSLLGPPPGTQVLEARTEERFQRLAQARANTRAQTHHTPRPQPANPPHSLPSSSTRRSHTLRCLLPPRPPAVAARRQARLAQAHGGHGSASPSASSAS